MQDHANEREGETETLGLVFDIQDEFSGRAREFVKAYQADPEYADKLGGLMFDDSKRHPGLQAADLVAFEARRYLGGEQPRQQWLNLQDQTLSDGQPMFFPILWDAKLQAFVAEQLRNDLGTPPS